MAKRILTLLLLASSARTAIGAEVIGVAANRKSVAINHETIGKWGVDDRVCVLQANVDVVCGVVVKTTAKGAIVKLDTTFDGVAIGDLVRKAGMGRKIAMETSADIQDARSPRTIDLSLGVGIGPTFFFPTLHFQIALGRKIALGAEPFYYRSSGADTSVSAIGGFLTASYYSDGYFRGIWVQLGGGVNSLSVSSSAISESATALTFLATVGWRGRFGKSFNVGVGGGLQYTAQPKLTSIELKSAGAQPLALVDFGFTF